jgi:hypothetical protein
MSPLAILLVHAIIVVPLKAPLLGVQTMQTFLQEAQESLGLGPTATLTAAQWQEVWARILANMGNYDFPVCVNPGTTPTYLMAYHITLAAVLEVNNHNTYLVGQGEEVSYPLVVPTYGTGADPAIDWQVLAWHLGVVYDHCYVD